MRGNSGELTIFPFRSLPELHLGQVADLYQQLLVCEFTLDGRYYADGLVSIANFTIDFTADRHCDHVRYAFLLSGKRVSK